MGDARTGATAPEPDATHATLRVTDEFRTNRRLGPGRFARLTPEPPEGSSISGYAKGDSTGVHSEIVEQSQGSQSSLVPDWGKPAPLWPICHFDGDHTPQIRYSYSGPISYENAQKWPALACPGANVADKSKPNVNAPRRGSKMLRLDRENASGSRVRCRDGQNRRR